MFSLVIVNSVGANFRGCFTAARFIMRIGTLRKSFLVSLCITNISRNFSEVAWSWCYRIIIARPVYCIPVGIDRELSFVVRLRMWKNTLPMNKRCIAAKEAVIAVQETDEQGHATTAGKKASTLAQTNIHLRKLACEDVTRTHRILFYTITRLHIACQ